MANKSMRPVFAIASLTLFLAVACGTHPAGTPVAEKRKELPADSQKAKEAAVIPLPVQPIRSAEVKAKSAKRSSAVRLTDETPQGQASSKIEWGREATLDEIIAMAKNGEIRQIEWHVMPNVIRAQAADGRVFHIRNENKGIDIRSTLINAGINIGKGGIIFRHVF